MKTVYFILAFMLHYVKVESTLVCDSDFCVCHHNNKSDQDLIGDLVDCSYDPAILRRNLTLPDIAYTLNLSRNNLTNVQYSHLLKSSFLTELNLNNNEIIEISANALQLPNLKRLDLSDNQLEVIDDGTFKFITKLEYLNLANNKFSIIGKLNFHNLRYLTEIILDNNNLGPSLEENNLFDRDGYGLTHKIQSLSISGINLSTIHDNFFVDAFDLKRLIISNNKLTETFEFPFTLEYLDLSGNPISYLSEEDFADLLALKELKLNNLLIKEVPSYAFASLHSLTHLELERNENLVNFSTTAFGCEVLEDADDFPLEKLSLKGSRLTTLDRQLEVPFGQLMRLDLQGNFWHCDCNLKWIKQLQIRPEDYEHLRCFTPKPLHNSKIFELKDKYFVCTAKNRHIVITICVISFCVMLSCIAIWMFVFMPKFQSRCNFVTDMYSSAGYSVLPVQATMRDPI